MPGQAASIQCSTARTALLWLNQPSPEPLMNNQPKQLELFPSRDMIPQAIDELASRLPITNRNELIAALALYQNTLIEEERKDLAPGENS